jgi:hypothetical protein
MSTQKRLFFSPVAGFVIVMLLAGMLYAPTALANAESDNGKSKGKSSSNSNNDGEKDNDDKCNKHKYQGECDNEKPGIEIDSPGNHGKVGSSITVKGKASDSGSGIHDVEVKVDGKSFTVVSTHSGDWTFMTSGLHKGNHTITAKAIDKSHNIARAHVSINVA